MTLLLTAVTATCLSATLLVSPAAATSAGPTLPTPESEVGVTGTPFTGTRPDGTVYGLLDAHPHLVMQDGMGGAAVCGEVFSRGGHAAAHRDCRSRAPHGRGGLPGNQH